ncbi:MAG: hypothetical protein JWP00_722 [Chloroflexi bacterium]|jgi:hypothetical protein|nr:hypothetical protein [Chloroflexota bacterium]
MDRSTVKTITLIFGIVYLAVGILGFIPGITQATSVTGTSPNEGLLMGIFGVNLLHNLSHLLFAAILIGGALMDEHVYTANKILFVVFVVLVISSFIDPVVDSLALNVPDLALHAGSALLTGYLGFLSNREARVARS